MKSFSFATATILLLICFSGFSQQPSPEQQRLSVFIGRWTVEGSENSYLEICDRIQGNHIQCRAVSAENGKTDTSFSYLSWSAAENAYVYYGIYGSGSSRTLRGVWDEDKFIFEGKRKNAETTTKWRIYIKPIGKNLNLYEERSVNGGNWEKRAEILYIRADRP
jgi:hypothetical protein